MVPLGSNLNGSLPLNPLGTGQTQRYLNSEIGREQIFQFDMAVNTIKFIKNGH